MAALAVSVLGFRANAQEDVTNEYLTNADLSTVDSGWDYYSDAFKYTDWKTDGEVAVVEFYSQWDDPIKDITQKDFKFSQTVTLPAGDYRIAVNAFYRNERGDGTNADKAWIFAGEKKQNIVALDIYEPTGGSNGLYSAALAFSKGEYSNAFDFTVEEEQEIEIGFQGYFNRSLSWCILGPVKLYKYSLEAYINDYNAKVAEAEALYDSPMNAGVLAALKEAAEVDVESMETSAPITEAIKTLTAAIAEANKSIENYKAIKAVLDMAKTLTSQGQEEYFANETIAELLSGYNDATIEAMTDEQKAAATALYAELVKTYPSAGADMTVFITNPEINGFTGWTEERPYAGNGPLLNNVSMEYWAGNASNREEASFDYYQVVTGLPAGKYTISAEMYNSLNGEEGDYTVFSPTSGVYAKSGDVEVYKLVDVDGTTLTRYTTDEISVIDGTLRIGVKNQTTPMAARWFVADNFKLTLVEPFITVDGLVYEIKSENLIENGSFEEGFTGWTQAKDFKTEIKDGFELKTEGAKDGKNYLVGTTNSGSTDAKSLGTAWQIDTDKTYLFSYYVKKEAGHADATEYDFLKTALTNTPGAETEVLGTPNIDSDTEWCQFQKVFENTEYTYLQVQFRWLGGQWGFDDFTLYEVELLSSELDVAKATANNALDALSPVGDGLFMYSQADIDAAKAAIEAAESVEAVKEVEMPTKALPVANQAYAITNKTADGNLCAVSGAGLVAVVPDASVYFTAVEGGYVLSNAEGEYIFQNNNGNANNIWTLSTTKDLEKAYVLTVNVVDGGYTLQGKNGLFGTDNAVAGSSVYADKGVDKNGVWSSITEAEATYAVNVTSAGYATWVAPADVDFTGVKAYVVSKVTGEDEVTAQLTDVATAKAGVPVVLEAEAGIYALGATEAAEEIDGENLLKVAGEGGVAAAAGIYVLANLDEEKGVGFYALDDDYTLPEGKVYLDTNGTSVKFIGFGFGDATGINGVENAANGVENAVIYNVAGQRVSNPTKGGIYIINGKKVLVK